MQNDRELPSNKNRRKDQHPSVIDQIIRASAYALTSLCAHSSGYLLQASTPTLGDFLLVLALWTTSLPFFLDYAISYHVEDPLGEEDQHAARWAKSNARPVIIGFSLAIATILILAHRVRTENFGHQSFWIMLIIFATLFISYGRYTVRLVGGDSPVIMRHHLVWPVVLSIALPLYSGIIFSTAWNETIVFTPIICLVIFFFLTRRIRRLYFVASSLAPLAIIIALTLSGADSYIKHFSTMTFYLSIAAYLAVFEAWGLTASLSMRKGLPAESHIPYTQTRSYRYYLATLLALCAAGLGMPILYTFSDYGRIFFYGTTVHSALAFLTWYWAGGNHERLKKSKWIWLKTIVGFLFLAVLVLDAWWNTAPTKRFLKNYVSLDFVAMALILPGFAIGYAMFLDKEKDFFKWLAERKRTAVLLVAIVLATLMAIGAIGLEDWHSAGSLEIIKGDRAFMVYIGFIVVASTLLLLRGKFKGVLGTLLLTRVFTSGVIGLVVLLPSLRSGESLIAGILRALPFFLASSGGFALNDYCDYERDLIGKPFRPLPRHLLSRRTALYIGTSLVVAATCTMLLSSGSKLGLALQASAVLGVIIYNIIITRAGWFKGLLTASLCMLPLVYVIHEFGYPNRYWLIITGGYFFCVGRELLMDILDMPSDRETGLNTLPMILGLVRSQRIGMICGICALLTLVVFRQLQSNLGHRSALDAAIAILICLGFLWQHSISATGRRQIIRLGWIPMLLALTTFIN